MPGLSHSHLHGEDRSTGEFIMPAGIWIFVVLTSLVALTLMDQWTAPNGGERTRDLYVDSRGGNDDTQGTSSETAWKTLGKVNANNVFKLGTGYC